MPLQDILKKIKYDIEDGNLGITRDRVNSLIYSYPNELSLRKMLGDIYWELKYPAMAGRFWYLVEHKTPNMISAFIVFDDAWLRGSYLLDSKVVILKTSHSRRTTFGDDLFINIRT